MQNFNSGNFVNQGRHKSFIPEMINREYLIDDMNTLYLLSLADRQLGRLDMYSEYVNLDLYISMHIAKEATKSPRIEGTITTVEEAFMDKNDISGEKRDDWEEVQNYIKAMNETVAALGDLPFSTRLIKMAHERLIQGVRGGHKTPGEFRRSQNWIGGATLNEAVFVPPPHTYISDLMGDLEKFANDHANLIPDLLKIALIHYQFETIHPFLDGNGRVGRLLITLYLVNKEILKRPILYLSDYFERHRSLYYDNLTRVRTHNDINQWFRFFLTGIIETSKQGIKVFDGVLQLQKEIEQILKSFRYRAADARRVIDYMYKQPVVDAAAVEKIIGKSSVSAYKLINDLESKGVITEITGAQRNRIFAFKKYIDIFIDN
ncbi:MAG: Fic family protein [Candidatus Kapaibacterium sp.]